MFQYKRKSVVPKHNVKKNLKTNRQNIEGFERFRPLGYLQGEETYTGVLQRARAIPTAIAPTASFQSSISRPSAGSARILPYTESLFRTQGIPSAENVLDLAEEVFSYPNWKSLLDGSHWIGPNDIEEEIQAVFMHWHDVLPNLLKHCGFSSYGGKRNHIYIRAGSIHEPVMDKSGGHKEIQRTESIAIERHFCNKDAIRQPRSYGQDENIKRYLRHCAAALSLCFQLNEEIQCYYEKETSIVYIAVNINSNRLIEIDGNRVIDFMGAVYRAYEENTDECEDSIKGLMKTLISEKGEKIRNQKFRPILERLAHGMESPFPESATFKVLRTESNNSISGLHAERQLLYFLREKNREEIFLDPDCLGGIRRPCFICASLCFSDINQVHAGVVWDSKAASSPKDWSEMFQIIKTIKANKNLTYISHFNRLLTNCDSVSIEEETET